MYPYKKVGRTGQTNLNHTMRSTVRVNTNGRVVVPSHVRKELGVEHGDLVEIEVQPVEGSD